MSLETKQICAKALLNLVAKDTLPTLIQVKPKPMREDASTRKVETV